MLRPLAAITVLLAALATVVAAYELSLGGGDEETLVESAMPIHSRLSQEASRSYSDESPVFQDADPISLPNFIQGMTEVRVNPTAAAQSVSEVASADPTPGPGEISQPCLEGRCSMRDVSAFELFSGGSGVGALFGGELHVATVEDVLERGLRLAGASPTHFAIRGTAQADSVRCEWRGVARTLAQREATIRFWLDLDTDEELPSVTEVERRFIEALDRANPAYPETVKANFLAIARGGLSTGYMFLTCYVDYSVSEYLLGSGSDSTTTLGLAYDRMGEIHSYELYKVAHSAGEFGEQELFRKARYEDHISQIAFNVELALSIMLAGHEAVVFLAPMGAHNAIAVEAWQAVAQWDVQPAEDGTLYAVRYGAREGDPEHTQTLANLKSRITAATSATSTTATSTATSTTATSTTATSTAATTARIATVSGLNQYYHNIGAYSDITPGDNATTTFTPAQPPPRYAPAPAGLSASGSGEDTANLSWFVVSGASGYQIQHRQTGEGRWTTAEESATTTTRSVTGLWCGRTHEFRVGAHGDGTTYNARAGLWSPTATTTLDACTPHPPRFTADSYSFVVGVGSSPGSPVGTVSAIDVNEDPVAHSITAGSGAGKFTIDAVTGEITVAASLGPTVGIIYELTVSAADGVSVTDSATVRVTTVCLGVTATCNHKPAFSTSPYAFSVAEDAATSATVGTVSASDSDGDTVTYSIASGNGDGVFSINSDTGEVIVAGALDYESVSSYTLTVEARDGKENSTAQATVEISVTDVAETPPPPPQTVTANSNQDSVTPSSEARDDSPAAGSTSCGGRRWRGERAPIAHEGDTGNSKTVKAIDAAGAGTVSGFANLKTPAQP